MSGTFETPVKSGPTSGPFTVSSQVTQEPHGIRPPEQFIIVPLRLVNALIGSPVGVTWIVVVPPPAWLSYGVPGPNGAPGLLTSWLRTRIELRRGPSNAPMPSCRPGSSVPSWSVTGVSVSWKDRYLNPSCSHRRTTPSRSSGIGTRAPGSGGVWASAGIATRPANGPPTAAPAAVVFRSVRRSTDMVILPWVWRGSPQPSHVVARVN